MPAASAAVRRPWVTTVLRYAVTVACAGGAGVHAALVPSHYAEGGLPLGGVFTAAAVALAVSALAVRRPRHDRWAPGLAAGALIVIAVSYLLSRTAGLPLLISQPERPDPLGGATTAAELAGALAGAVLMSRKDRG